MSNMIPSGGVLKVAPGTLADRDFSSGDGGRLTVDKQRHRLPIRLRLTDGTDVTTVSKVTHVTQASGVIDSIEAMPNTAPAGGGDKKWTVDVKKSTGAGAFATVLSAVVTIDTTSVDRRLQVGALSTAAIAYVDGDLFQVVVTATGATGSQGQGGCVTLWLDEQAP